MSIDDEQIGIDNETNICYNVSGLAENSEDDFKCETSKLKAFLNSPSFLRKVDAHSNIRVAKSDRVLQMVSGAIPNDIYVKQSGLDRWLDSNRKAVAGASVFHSLHYVVKGEGVLEVNGKKYRVTENTMFVLFADVDVHYYANAKNPWTYIYVDIGGILQSSIVSKLGFTITDCIYRPKKSETIKSQFYKVYESALETGVHSFRTSADLYELLAKVEEERFGVKPANLRERYIKEALTYIENNIETADVKSTAADCSISSAYLTRVCKSVLGISLKDLITVTRLQVACNYLKYTRKSIKEVGESVGFPQRKYFAKVFKSVFDVTPTQYRKEN